MKSCTKQKQSRRYRKQTYSYQKVSGWGEINQEIEMDIYTLLYIKQVTNNDPL